MNAPETLRAQLLIKVVDDREHATRLQHWTTLKRPLINVNHLMSSASPLRLIKSIRLILFERSKMSDANVFRASRSIANAFVRVVCASVGRQLARAKGRQ